MCLCHGKILHPSCGADWRVGERLRLKGKGLPVILGEEQNTPRPAHSENEVQLLLLSGSPHLRLPPLLSCFSFSGKQWHPMGEHAGASSTTGDIFFDFYRGTRAWLCFSACPTCSPQWAIPLTPGWPAGLERSVQAALTVEKRLAPL